MCLHTLLSALLSPSCTLIRDESQTFAGSFVCVGASRCVLLALLTALMLEVPQRESLLCALARRCLRNSPCTTPLSDGAGYHSMLLHTVNAERP